MTTIYDYLSQDLYTINSAGTSVSTIQSIQSTGTETYSETIVTGNLDGNLTFTGGFIQSYNFVSGTSGWRLSADGTLEAINAILSGSLSAITIDIGGTDASSFHVDIDGNVWLGASTYASAPAKISNAGVATFSSVAITGGSISIGSGNNIFKADSNGIYLGNATFASAPFRVSMNGSTVVSSLERNDFHWFTIFESIDGFTKGGTPVLNPDFVSIITTNVNDNECRMQKIASYSNSFTWAKRRKIKFGLILDTNTNQQFELMTGNGQYGPNNRHFGFRVVGDDIYGVTDDGTSQSETLLLNSLATGTIYECEAKFIPGVSVEFYINGTLRETNTGNLPSTTADAQYLFDFTAHTEENAIKSFKLTYYDFWQQN